MPKSSTYPDLERKKGGPDNWVEAAGGLPRYIERIAKHLHYEKGHSISTAIAMAVNTVKRWAKGTNHNGSKLKPQTVAKAAKAVGEWEAKKARGKGKRLREEIVATPEEQLDLGRRLASRLTLVEGMLGTLETGRLAAVQNATALLEADGSKGRPGISLSLGGGAADAREVARTRERLEEERDELAALAESLGALTEATRGRAATEPGGRTAKASDAPKAKPKPKRKPDEAAPADDSGDGERVSALQRRLTTLGFELKDDGQFGPKTDGAVREFQRVANVKPDGLVGPVTTAALKSAPTPEEMAAMQGELDAASTPAGAPDTETATRPERPAASSDSPPAGEKGAGSGENGAKPAAGGQASGQASSMLYKGMGVGESPAAPVKELQGHLGEIGYDLEEDGVFGPKTEGAVKRFQKRWGLRSDGLVGPKTSSALETQRKMVGELGEAVLLREAASAAGDSAAFARHRARERVLRGRLEEANVAGYSRRVGGKVVSVKEHERRIADMLSSGSPGKGFRGTVRGVDRARLGKMMRPLPEDTTLYMTADTPQPGGFRTTTRSPEVARAFGGGEIMAVTMPKGSLAYERNARADLPKLFAGEQEVILPPGVELEDEDGHPLGREIAEKKPGDPVTIGGKPYKWRGRNTPGTAAYVEDENGDLIFIDASGRMENRIKGGTVGQVPRRKRVKRAPRRVEECGVEWLADMLVEEAKVVARLREADTRADHEEGHRKVKCPKCGRKNSATRSRCAKCGHGLAAARKAKFAKLEEASVRGAARQAAAELKRLPDGTFAPKGRGQILRPGQKVSVPHKDGGGKTVTGVVKPSGRVALTSGPDQGTDIDVKVPVEDFARAEVEREREEERRMTDPRSDQERKADKPQPPARIGDPDSDEDDDRERDLAREGKPKKKKSPGAGASPEDLNRIADELETYAEGHDEILRDDWEGPEEPPTDFPVIEDWLTAVDALRKGDIEYARGKVEDFDGLLDDIAEMDPELKAVVERVKASAPKKPKRSPGTQDFGPKGTIDKLISGKLKPEDLDVADDERPGIAQDLRDRAAELSKRGLTAQSADVTDLAIAVEGQPWAKPKPATQPPKQSPGTGGFEPGQDVTVNRKASALHTAGLTGGKAGAQTLTGKYEGYDEAVGAHVVRDAEGMPVFASDEELGAKPSPGAGGGWEPGGGKSIKDYPLGTTIRLADGNEYVIHKPVNPPWMILKPVGGGKAKPMHNMAPPVEVNTSTAYDAPEAGLPAANPEGVTVTSGALSQSSLSDSPGRGPTGKVRNFKAMGATKLKNVISELESYGQDQEALEAAKKAAAGKGIDVPTTAPTPAPTPATPTPGQTGDEGDLLGQLKKSVSAAKKGELPQQQKPSVESYPPSGPTAEQKAANAEKMGKEPKPKAKPKPKSETPPKAEAKPDPDDIAATEEKYGPVVKGPGGSVPISQLSDEEIDAELAMSEKTVEVFESAKESLIYSKPLHDQAIENVKRLKAAKAERAEAATQGEGAKNSALEAYKAAGGNDPEVLKMLGGG